MVEDGAQGVSEGCCVGGVSDAIDGRAAAVACITRSAQPEMSTPAF